MFGEHRLLQTDPEWHDLIPFHEYFHGDTGGGLGRVAPDRLDGAGGQPDHGPGPGPVTPGRHRRCRATLAATITALTLAACGGHTVTKQDVIARGNAICAGTLRQIRALPAPTSGGASPQAMAQYLERVVPIIDKEIAGIQSLPRPPRDRAILNRYVTAISGTAAQYKALAVAAKAGDSDAISQALANLADSPAATLAGESGLSQCASAAGTAIS